MSNKKGQNRLTEKNLENFLKMMEHLPEETKELVRQLAKNMEQDSNDPDDLNISYYSYEGPEQYNKGSKRVPKWLKGMWDVYDYDSWLALCTYYMIFVVPYHLHQSLAIAQKEIEVQGCCSYLFYIYHTLHIMYYAIL